jgi:hypothetical protein
MTYELVPKTGQVVKSLPVGDGRTVAESTAPQARCSRKRAPVDIWTTQEALPICHS